MRMSHRTSFSGLDGRTHQRLRATDRGPWLVELEHHASAVSQPASCLVERDCSIIVGKSPEEGFHHSLTSEFNLGRTKQHRSYTRPEPLRGNEQRSDMPDSIATALLSEADESDRSIVFGDENSPTLACGCEVGERTFFRLDVERVKVRRVH
jgi:hypothetical protein